VRHAGQCSASAVPGHVGQNPRRAFVHGLCTVASSSRAECKTTNRKTYYFYTY
jgi:hypothetical protein